MVKTAAIIEAINGPMYGIMLSTAQRKAMINALEIPKIDNTIKYKMNTIASCSNKPMK